MAEASTSTSAPSLKLLVGTKAQRVLCAEAGKDAFDSTEVSGTECPSCYGEMADELELELVVDGDEIVPASSDGCGYAREGFVHGFATYTIKDDLTVAPLSTISGISHLTSLGITDISAVEEKTVQLGQTEKGTMREE